MKTSLTKELISKNSNLSFYQYIGMLPNPDKILARHNNTYDVYHNLKNDPHIWSCIQSRKAGLLDMKLTLNQKDADTEIYNFVKFNIAKINIAEFVRQSVEAILFGFQPFEIIWKESKFNNKEVLIVDSIEPLPQEYFIYDTAGKLKIKDYNEPKGKQIPQYKIINIQHEASYTNPYGQALLAKCYWPCTFKNSAIRFWVNFIEKFGTPTIVANIPLGFNDDEETADILLQKTMEQLQQMQEQNVIVTQGAIQVSMHDNNKQGSVDLYKELVNQCNAEISKILLSQTLTTEINVGSFAAAKTHQEIRTQIIKSDLKLVEWALEQLIKYIVAVNFGEEAENPTCNLIEDDTNTFDAQ